MNGNGSDPGNMYLKHVKYNSICIADSERREADQTTVEQVQETEEQGHQQREEQGQQAEEQEPQPREEQQAEEQWHQPREEQGQQQQEGQATEENTVTAGSAHVDNEEPTIGQV